MRKEFAQELYKYMAKDDRIWLITGDLGYGIWDEIRRDFSDRFVNTGASEQAMIGIACGLGIEGKIPFVYSITPFLIYRPFETIRNYVDREKINVKLIGSGRDKDYAHDGFSHDATGVGKFLDLFENIEQLWPMTDEDIPSMVDWMVKSKTPQFISLRR